MAGTFDERRRVVRVGATLALTGRFALQGRQAWRGLRLWRDDTNVAGGLLMPEHGGRSPVELLIYDDESRASQAAAGTERLLGVERVDLLMGPYASGPTLAAAAVAERHRRLLWNHGGASAAGVLGGGRWTVPLLAPASAYFTGILELAGHLAPPACRVALLHGTGGTFAQAVVDGAAAYAQRHGWPVPLRAPYPDADAGWASLVEPLQQHQPEIILGVGRTEADLALARQLRAQRVTARVLGLVATPLEHFQAVLDSDAEGFVGPSQWEPGVPYRPDRGPTAAAFTARFRARFQREPDYPAAQAYAAGLVAQVCIERAGSLRDEALRAAAGTLALTTFYGAFRLDAATGEQVGHRLVVVQWQGRRKAIVWPPEAADGRLITPEAPPPRHLGKEVAMPSFAQEIRPLFRDEDVDAMTFAFDLRDYEEVKENAEAIYERLAEGSMPCDGPWPADHIALFRQWIDAGCAP